MKTRIFGLLSLALLLALPALPCSIAQIPHEIDDALRGVDVIPPSAPQAEVSRITRGKGPVPHGEGLVSVSSCDDIGFIVLSFSRLPQDDRATASEIGYLFEFAAGDPPPGFTLPEAPLRILADAREFTLHWSDGATDEQEPLDFAITIVAVDRAGNRSEPSNLVWIRDPGRHASSQKQ